MFKCFRKKKVKALPTLEHRPVAPLKRRLRTNQAGLDLIKEFEGYHSKPYLCPARVPTIGYGSIVYPNGKAVTLKDKPCNKKEAEAWLASELDHKEQRIESFVKTNNVQVTQNQFSALVSFAYNLGTGPIVTHGKSMNKALLSGNKIDMANAFLIYNKARSGIFRRLKELKGLTRRRKAERHLFLK